LLHRLLRQSHKRFDARIMWLNGDGFSCNFLLRFGSRNA
jgi:hypothetical protein